MHVAGASVPVRGLVVSAGTARFCAALAEVVVLLDDLPSRLTGNPAEGSNQAQLDAAWHELTNAAARSPLLRAAHLQQLQVRTGCQHREFFLGAMAGATCLLLACCLASPRVNPVGMFPGGAGLRRMRAAWSLHPGRPSSAEGNMPEPRLRGAP